MGKIVFPLMGSARRRLFDIRRVWGANVQEQRFVDTLKNFLDFEIIELPEINRYGYLKSFYHDFFEEQDVSVLITTPDILNIRFYIKNTPAFVSTFHSVGHIDVIQNLVPMTATFAPEFDRFIVGSQDAAQSLKKVGKNFQCSVLPTYGVYTPLFDRISMEPDEVKEKYKIPMRDKILLFVGRVSRSKNIHELIRMFKVIHTRVPETSLLIAGPLDPLMIPRHRTKWRQKLNEIVHKLNISDSVFFTFETEDIIRPRDLSSIYNAADIFLYPTVYAQETRGIAPIEAGFCKLPIVATSWNGLRDTVIHGKTGYLVDVFRTANYPIFDFYKFIQYTVYLLRHPELCTKMGERSRVVAEKFTTERTAKAFAKIVYDCKERYESRTTDPPYLHDALQQKMSVFSNQCPEQYVRFWNRNISVNEAFRFGYIEKMLYRHQMYVGSMLWEVVKHFANRDVAEIDVRKYPSFTSTTEMVIQPYSKIKGINSPTIPLPTFIFWFIPLTAHQWKRFFECFREVDTIPIFTPEIDTDYDIAEILVSRGFLLPLEDPPDIT